MDKKGKKVVALISTSINERGGRCRHFANLYKYFSKEFKIVIFICSKVENKIRELMLQNGVLEDDLVFLSRVNKLLVIPFIFEIRNNLLKKQANIVHTFDLQSDIFGGLAARLAGIKNIYALFESKVIPENTMLIKRIFYIVMNMLIKDIFVNTVVVTEGLRKEVVLHKYRKSEKVKLIRIGINIDNLYKDRPWPFDKLKNGEPLIGAISRLSYEKGIDRFINVMPLINKVIPKARFVIIGKGPEEGKLKLLANKLGVYNKIDFKPWSNNVFAELEKIDIFVMPSLREGLPNILLEAMSLSRPIVASDIEGISDLIINNDNGCLVNTANVKEFAESIIYLCQNSDKAILMGKSGYHRVQDEFTIENEIKMFSLLYRSYGDFC